MVIRHHFPLQKVLSKILNSLKKDNIFLAKKWTKFYNVYLSVFFENLSNPKYKSLKLFTDIFYGYTHKIGWFWVELIWFLNDFLGQSVTYQLIRARCKNLWTLNLKYGYLCNLVSTLWKFCYHNFHIVEVLLA